MDYDEEKKFKKAVENVNSHFIEMLSGLLDLAYRIKITRKHEESLYCDGFSISAVDGEIHVSGVYGFTARYDKDYHIVLNRELDVDDMISLLENERKILKTANERAVQRENYIKERVANYLNNRPWRWA